MPDGEEFNLEKFLAEAALVHEKEAVNQLNKRFWEKWQDKKFQKKYGFPQNAHYVIAKEVQKIDNTVIFKSLKECLGKDHWALNYIKVGICISDLSDQGEREKIDNIRDYIRKKKGWKPLRIVNMGSTGAIKGILAYLEKLKRDEFSCDAISAEFERMIEDWEQMTIFVEKKNDKLYVKGLIAEKVERKLPLFFAFSYGVEANNTAMCSIAEMNMAGGLKYATYGYIWDTYPHYDGVGTKIYMWEFQLVNYSS